MRRWGRHLLYVCYLELAKEEVDDDEDDDGAEAAAAELPGREPSDAAFEEFVHE